MGQQLLLDKVEFADDDVSLEAWESLLDSKPGSDAAGKSSLDLEIEALLKLESPILPLTAEQPAGDPAPTAPAAGHDAGRAATQHKSGWVSDAFIWQGELGVSGEQVAARQAGEVRSEIAQISPGLFIARELNPNLRPQAVDKRPAVKKARLRKARFIAALLVLGLLVTAAAMSYRNEGSLLQLRDSVEQGMDSLPALKLDALLGLKDKLLAQLNELDRQDVSVQGAAELAAQREAKMVYLRQRLAQIRAQLKQRQLSARQAMVSAGAGNHLDRSNMPLAAQAAIAVATDAGSLAYSAGMDFEQRLAARSALDNVELGFEQRLAAQRIVAAGEGGTQPVTNMAYDF